jgi:hypothetical protein
MDTIALIIAATEYIRKLVPERMHAWLLPLVALVITALVTILFVDQPFTLQVARTAIMQWLSAIGLTGLALRLADKASTKAAP